ncbi:MAG: cob(I)yrinic acid a,c-diamide adenosyltransferase [Phycisphaeraceae bacterium]|nr:cob(I)yrinic acid a,c-diamide adenosyltransferase [Phycisphaerae bacterium]MBX3392023.1 cob(I)yrinic acid a,c-diamide adenosyltransferase [Phycisphaeraceae bacterium]HRJ50419.1 cob(I)yrinic acid a,c-diamide adenosyltransferase [Phycisphaerales bacterium]
MVKLNRIYTKTGDGGTTGLASGVRVPKDDPRVETYGTVDEANAAVGLAITTAGADGPDADPVRKEVVAILRSIQHDLFDCGADLATPVESSETPGSRLRILPSQTERLEHLIDEYNDPLSPLTSFVLPGGTPFAAGLHLARTIVRRAERLVATLRRTDPDTTNAETLRYLNRLSDLLFVLARIANDRGAGDVLWIPGSNRPR